MSKEHNYEDEIKCPYCDYEDPNSWEFGDDNDTHECGSCGETFNVEVYVEVTYSTYPIALKKKQS